MKLLALSWPAPPFENAFIETATGMFEALGVTVRGHNPTQWSTPREVADLYVLHWPDAIFWNDASPVRRWFWIARILTNLALLKLRGTRILWFVHNLQPHDLPEDRQRAWRVYANGLSRLVDGWITLAPSTAIQVIERYPALARRRHTYIWHPSYGDQYAKTRREARAELGLPPSATIFGHAGLLRPYKKLAPLAARFAEIAPDGAVLFLTGMAKDGGDAELAPLVSAVPRLFYREGRLSRPDFDRALTAMDVFVAPYSGFLHSGSLVHALSRGCIVVAPRVHFTEDLARKLGPKWIVLYEGAAPDRDHLAHAALAAQELRGKKPDLTFMQPEVNSGRLGALLNDMGLSCCA